MARKNLRNDQWARIESMLPGKAGDRGVTARDNRLFVEAVLWIARAESPWRDLPAEFGPWNSVYKRYSRWSASGVWRRVFGVLAKDRDFAEVFLDTGIVRAHWRAARTARKKAARHRSGRAAG